MQISKISSNSFGLKFTDNAKTCIENEFRFTPQKMLAFDYFSSVYPDDILLDIKEADKGFNIILKDTNGEKTTQSNNINPGAIEKMIKKFIKRGK